MKLYSYLDSRFIFQDLEGNNKEELFRNLIEHASKSDNMFSRIKEEVTSKVLEREKSLTTFIGSGIALPHTRIKDYDDVLIVIGLPKTPTSSITVEDKEELIRIIFLIVTSEKKSTLMLQLLSGVAKLSKDIDFIEKIHSIKSSDKVLKAIKSSNIDIKKNILAEDIMNINISPASPLDTLEMIVNRLSYEKEIALPVIDKDGYFLGEMTEKELIKFGMPKITSLVSNLTLLQNEELFEDYFKQGSRIQIKDLYRKKVLTVDRTSSIMEVAFLMLKNKNSRAYVIENNKYLGVINRSDIVRKVLNI